MISRNLCDVLSRHHEVLRRFPPSVFAPEATRADCIKINDRVTRERAGMDALDEFFAVWTEPEAWCEICGEFPAIHVVLRDTGGKFGGIMSHVRIWNPSTQTRVPACRHCCKDQINTIGQSMTAPIQHASGQSLPSGNSSDGGWHSWGGASTTLFNRVWASNADVSNQSSYLIA